MESDLWGNTIERKPSYWVFHDESIPRKRWLLIGLLFVHANHLDQVSKVLKRCRIEENYYGEIHFSALPKSFAGKGSAKARVARRWLQAYEQGLSDLPDSLH